MTADYQRLSQRWLIAGIASAVLGSVTFAWATWRGSRRIQISAVALTLPTTALTLLRAHDYSHLSWVEQKPSTELPRLCPEPLSAEELALYELVSQGAFDEIDPCVPPNKILATAIRHSPQAYRLAIQRFQVTYLDLSPLYGHITDGDILHLAEHQPRLEHLTLNGALASPDALEQLLQRCPLTHFSLRNCDALTSEFVETISRCRGDALQLLKCDFDVKLSQLADFKCLEELAVNELGKTWGVTVPWETSLKRLQVDTFLQLGNHLLPRLTNLEKLSRIGHDPGPDLKAKLERLLQACPKLTQLHLAFPFQKKHFAVLSKFKDRLTSLAFNIEEGCEADMLAFLKEADQLTELEVNFRGKGFHYKLDSARWQALREVLPTSISRVSLGCRGVIEATTLKEMASAPFELELREIQVVSGMRNEDLAKVARDMVPTDLPTYRQLLLQFPSLRVRGEFRGFPVQDLDLVPNIQPEDQLKLRFLSLPVASTADIEKACKLVEHAPIAFLLALGDTGIRYSIDYEAMKFNFQPLANRASKIPTLYLSSPLWRPEHMRPFIQAGEGRERLELRRVNLTTEQLIELLEEGHLPNRLSLRHCPNVDPDALRTRFPALHLS